MGIVLKQSLNNTIITYIGFGIGAVNLLFLYTNFMTDAYYGLIQFILSAASILMPLLAFGVPNTMVKFYSSFKESKTQDGFLTAMLLLPLLLIVPIALVSYLANDAIGSFLSKENALVNGYVGHIFLVGMAMAYFEVFYAWARVQMKSVFGNFMKEIFCRVGQTILLVLLYYDMITIDFFIEALVGFYLLRALIMKLYAFHLRMPKFTFSFPTGMGKILTYTLLIILGGSTAIVLLEVDKVMLNQYIKIENVAYYSVAGFMAAAVAVPSRAMNQIMYPLTAKLLNDKDRVGLKKLYQKSSLTLFLISGFLFVLLLLNLNEIYALLPDAYRGGFLIVFWIGMAKVTDAVLGNINSILFNSDYYRAVLFMGVGLALLTIVFNLWLIPTYGLNGAAIASFFAFFSYNLIKLIFVYRKYGMLPFSAATLKVLALLSVIIGTFYFVHFPFHPIVNIILKTALMSGLYVWVLYRFAVSEDLSSLLKNLLKRT